MNLFKLLLTVLITAAAYAAPSGVDFNADGTDDLLVRNTATGQTYSWLMKLLRNPCELQTYYQSSRE